ncbi:MAG: ATP synthase F1 subunit gamma [Ottowia sp.]
MSQLSDIRRHIESTVKTRQITDAMGRIAFIKMGAARKRAEALRPYRNDMLRVIARFRATDRERLPALLGQREQGRRVALIVVCTDRGLCGPLNLRLLQICIRQLHKWQQAGCEVSVTAIGSRSLGPLRRAGANIISQATQIGDATEPDDALIGAIAVPLHQYVQGEMDHIWLASNRFVNTLTYEPQLRRVLPLPPDLFDAAQLPDAPGAEYEFEPASGEAVVRLLVTRYTETLIYSAIAENVACEYCARMVAMKAASDNASRLIDELRLQFHKTRQEAITQELIELTTGADALRRI